MSSFKQLLRLACRAQRSICGLDTRIVRRARSWAQRRM